MLHSQIDTSFLITWIIGGVVAVIALILMITSGIAWLRSSDHLYSNSGFTFVVAALIFVVVGGIGTAVTFPPFSMQYHRYVPYTGVVKQVQSRFISDGNSSTQYFPVQFTNGDIRRCDDSRCTELKPGQTVTLLCELQFQFNASEGWDCNWGKLGANH
jgi:hypothetical protein